MLHYHMVLTLKALRTMRGLRVLTAELCPGSTCLDVRVHAVMDVSNVPTVTICGTNCQSAPREDRWCPDL